MPLDIERLLETRELDDVRAQVWAMLEMDAWLPAAEPSDLIRANGSGNHFVMKIPGYGVRLDVLGSSTVPMGSFDPDLPLMQLYAWADGKHLFEFSP